jgi:hypothetical protein
MTRHPTDHLDNRRPVMVLRPIPLAEMALIIQNPCLHRCWKRPETADEVIACNRIDSDLRRVVLLQEAWELDRAERRSGY